jgi:hypothetical protein
VFIRIEQMPDWIAWVQYVCAAKYGLNLASLVEFNPDLAQDEETRLEWAALLQSNAIYATSVGLYVGILMAIFVGFRVLSLLLLNYKAKFYN